MDAKHSAPGLLSWTRIASLIGCILIASNSGTVYLYSAYSPQLGARLHASHTQLSIIGFAANAGNYISNPVWGRMIDTMGPRIPLLGALLCYLVGYGGITWLYNGGIGAATSLPRAHFALLVISSLFVGLAISASLSTACNTAARNFPTSMRGRAIGFTAAGMGLSAFLWSTICGVFFAGNTLALLLLLTFGTSSVSIACLAVVRRIPLPHSTMNTDEGETLLNTSDDVSTTATQDAEGDCNTPLLGDRPGNNHCYLFGPSATERDRMHSCSPSKAGLPNIHGKQLLVCPKFYAIVLIMGTLCSIGVMYINNVGAITRALYAHSNPDYDEVEASKWQNAQVSTLSVGNFLGRVAIGLVSDYIRTHFHFPRSYCLCIVSVLFMISQAIAIGVSTVNILWIPTVILGAAYGSLFGLFPTIVAEWFGIAHMAETHGYILLPVLVVGNLLSFMFGRVFDAHNPRTLSTLGDAPSERQCLLGRECYVAIFWVTLLLSIIALASSTWASFHDTRAKCERKGSAVDVGERNGC